MIVMNYKIVKQKSQSKTIVLIVNGDEKEFSSFTKCDRFLNMWRGYTSTQIVNNKNVVLNYKYVLK